jgi:hypothetical protein
MRAFAGGIIGAGIVVAILGTAFGYSHPELNGWFALAIVAGAALGVGATARQ